MGSDVVVGGETGQSFLDGCGYVARQRDFGGDGLHLRCVVAQQALLDGGSVFGVHQCHVEVKA